MNKEYRVKSKQDFQKVISSKRKIADNNFVIYYLKNPNNEHNRFGISASKKLGCAVERVKIRRQVRMMILEITKEIAIQPMDYVIIVRYGYKNNDYHTNLNSLKKLFIKFGGKTNEK